MAKENLKPKSVFDPDRQHLGDVYAKALWGLAKASGQTDALVEELDSFVEALQQLPRLRACLESPQISFTEKNRLIEKSLDDRASKVFVNFVKVVTAKGRADCFDVIRRSVRCLSDQQADRVRATMVTAEAVDAAIQQRVAQRLGQVLGKQVSLDAQVDPAIIGGLVVRVGDTVYDGSLRNQLNQFRAAAVGRANQEIRKSLDRFASTA